MRRLVLTLLALAAAFPSAAAAHAPRAWMTTGDKSYLLTEQPRSALGKPVAGAPTITVDPHQSFQRIEG
jgi:glucosylceramidase